MTQRIFSLGRESLCLLLHGICHDWLVLEVTRPFRALEHDLQQWLGSSGSQCVAVKLALEVNEGKPFLSDGAVAEGKAVGLGCWGPSKLPVASQLVPETLVLNILVTSSGRARETRGGM